MLTTALVLTLCAQDFKQENKPENLKACVAALQKAIGAGDTKTSLAMTKSLLCDEARLKKALKEDVAKEPLDALVKMHKGYLDTDEAKLATALKVKPEQTEIRVHGATTEEIAKYEKDSVAFKEFPGGARKLAETILRPGVTFYEVEFLEPGKDAGMKFHLFFWDGERWAMLGAAWRVVDKK